MGGWLAGEQREHGADAGDADAAGCLAGASNSRLSRDCPAKKEVRQGKQKCWRCGSHVQSPASINPYPGTQHVSAGVWTHSHRDPPPTNVLRHTFGECFAVHRVHPARLVALGLLPVAPNRCAHTRFSRTLHVLNLRFISEFRTPHPFYVDLNESRSAPRPFFGP